MLNVYVRENRFKSLALSKKLNQKRSLNILAPVTQVLKGAFTQCTAPGGNAGSLDARYQTIPDCLHGSWTCSLL